MLSVRLSTHDISPIIWRRIFYEFLPEIQGATVTLAEIYTGLEADRAAMDFKTGSISYSSGIALYVLTRKIDPTMVFEVGTYIGRSAAAMAIAMDAGEPRDRLLQTCDISNDFVLNTKRFRTKVQGMPKTDSTAALNAAITAGRPVDLFHFDGRLNGPDLDMVAALSHEGTVIALDDFEGLEKGVTNGMLLKQTPKFSNHFLVEPPSPELLGPFGYTDRCLTALLIPPLTLKLASQ